MPGADTNHFLGYCDECDAHHMAGMTLEQVESWYHQGVLSQDKWEAYTHAWATSAARFGHYPGWAAKPSDPRVIVIVDMIREAGSRK